MSTRWTNRRRAAVACAILAVAAAAAVALLRQTGAYGGILAGGENAANRGFFSSVSPSAIDRIDVQSAGGDPLVLRRVRDGWTVESGGTTMPVRADRAARLFASPQGQPEIVRWMQAAVPPNEETPSHRETPEVIATFHAEGEEVETLVIGRALPKGNLVRTEVRGRGDSRFFLVVGDLTDNFAGESLLDWVPRRLFPDLQPGSIRALRVESASPAGAWSALRGNDDAWHVKTAGREGPGDVARIQRAIEAVAFLEIDGFPAAEPGERAAEWKIAFRVEGNPEETVLNVGPETAPGSGLWLAWISDDASARAIHRPLALLRDGAEFLAADADLRAERIP